MWWNMHPLLAVLLIIGIFPLTGLVMRTIGAPPGDPMTAIPLLILNFAIIGLAVRDLRRWFKARKAARP